MTREERIRNLHFSSDEESDFLSIYKRYESDEQIRGEKEKALQWRLEHLIPKSQLLLEKRYSSRQDIKCLFVLVGTTVEPLLLSILTLRPSEKLVLIYSSESKKQKKIIENTLFQNPGKNIVQKKWLCDDNAKVFIEQARNKIISIDEAPITNTTPEKVFAEIKSRIGSFQENDIGVDITGGKKSMVGGGFLAASINNYHLFYVDFDEYKDSLPVQGTEFIHILPNPYLIYNVREESLIQKFWERQDFGAVINVVEEALKKLTEDKAKAKDYGLEIERYRLRQINTAANCYLEWSKFNYSQSQIYAQLIQGLYFDYYKEKHYNILESLSQCQKLKKTPYGAILLALDRWTRGKDALDLNDFNKSALLFTQTIECLCTFRIIDLVNKQAIHTSCNQNFNPELEWFSIRALLAFLYGKANNNCVNSKPKKRENSGINQKFNWEENQCQQFTDTSSLHSDLAMLLNYRNYIAHFDCFDENSNTANRASCKGFKSVVQKFIELFITEYQNEDELKEKTFDDLKAQFEFAKFTDFNNSY